MLIIGDKEVQSNTIGVRSRKAGDLGAIAIDEFIEKVKIEVENYERQCIFISYVMVKTDRPSKKISLDNDSPEEIEKMFKKELFRRQKQL